MIDTFLDAAQSLLSPRGAAILFLAVIFLGLGIGVVMSFRRTGYVELKEWLTIERINHAFDETFGIEPAPVDAERFQAAILDEHPRSRPPDGPQPEATDDTADTQS